MAKKENLKEILSKVENLENYSVEETGEKMEEEAFTEDETTDKKEEYYFTAAELKKQQKRAEKRRKQVEKEEKLRKRNVGRMYRSSALIAVFAGIMQIIMGLPKEDGMTNIMLGATFICCGYLFYTMGNKFDKDKKKQEENR